MPFKMIDIDKNREKNSALTSHWYYYTNTVEVNEEKQVYKLRWTVNLKQQNI